MSPPASHASNTRHGEPRSASRKPLVVKTPVPIMLATTSAVALTRPSCRGALTPARGSARACRSSTSQLPFCLLASHRHETHGQDGTSLDFVSLLLEQIQALVVIRPDRDNHAATFLELLHQRLRDVVGSAG